VQVRILVLGTGVIGSVYASKLLCAGHDVVLLARGQRLVDLRSHGLLVQDAESGDHSTQQVTAVRELTSDDRFDVVLVAVRAEQLEGVLPVLTGMTDGSDVSPSRSPCTGPVQTLPDWPPTTSRCG
jgi:2-dehydropantoate 2-reductase